MFSALRRNQTRILPYAIGAAAVVTAAYCCTRMGSRRVINDPSKVFIGDGKWIDLSILRIEEESHDTRRFTFKLPAEDSELGLTLASALLARAKDGNIKLLIRPYTPVSDLKQKGSFQLVIKHYPDGKMTNHLFSLKPNDVVSFKGPIKKWQWETNSFDSITLLGAGTGITPLYQLAQHIVKNPNENTKVKLFYGNKSPADILLRKELDDLQKQHPEKFSVTYFVDKKEGGNNDIKQGFITKEFIASNAPKPDEKTKIFVCGPPPFMKAYSGEKLLQAQGRFSGILKELGYSSDQVFKF